MPISHIPILICRTHSHTGSQGHPYQTSLPTALWQRLRHVRDLIFSTFPSPLPRTATAHRDPSTPLTRRFFNRRFPAEKEGRKHCGTMYAPKKEVAFQAGGETQPIPGRLRQRPAPESGVALAEPATPSSNLNGCPEANHDGGWRSRPITAPEAGQGEGRGLGSVCFHRHRYRSRQRMVPRSPSAGREARPGYLNQPRF